MSGRARLAGLLGIALMVAVGCVPPPEPGLHVVYVERGPPRLRPENAGVAPGPGLVWMRGHWRWTGADYAWVPGQWVGVPAGHLTWVPGRWIQTRRGWFWIDGHWR